MIGRLSGILIEKNPPQITLDVHGVGWCRYGCTVTISSDTGVMTGGSGDALADGAVVVTASVSLDVTFDGDNLTHHH